MCLQGLYGESVLSREPLEQLEDFVRGVFEAGSEDRGVEVHVEVPDPQAGEW